VCLTMPAHVISVDGSRAVVEVGGLRRAASTLPAPEVRAGDWVIVAAGSVIRILEPHLAYQVAAAIRTATFDDTPYPEGDAS